jgi:hypothetical protein
MGVGGLQLTFYSVVTLGGHLLAAWLAAPHVNVQVPPVNVHTPDVVCSCECPAATAASHSFALGLALGAVLGLAAAALAACLARSACCSFRVVDFGAPVGSPASPYHAPRDQRPSLALPELPADLRGDLRRAATPASLRK